MLDNVFFLGAGFSKAIDETYPLMNELSEILFGKDYKDFTYINNLPTSIKNNTNNFERILTYLSTDFPWKTDYEKLTDKAEFLRLTTKIHDYFWGKARLSTKKYRDNKALWAYILLKNSPIITLNYDLLIERNLELVNKQIENPRLGVIVGNPESEDKFYKGAVLDIKCKTDNVINLSDEMPEILKLHGSVNWYYFNTGDATQIYCADKDVQIEDVLIGAYSPYIVPPILDKTSLYSHKILQHIWSKAYQYLKHAKAIYIIGFSFPETDSAIRYLFESALSSNKNNPNIYVVDICEKEEFKKRCISVLGENCKFEYCGEEALENFIKNELLTQIRQEEIKSKNNQSTEEHINDIWAK